MSAKKPGRTVNMRINPSNCMGVYDVILKVGMNPGDMTFSEAASKCFDMFMRGMRQANDIPEREGFEFNELMQAFKQPFNPAIGVKILENPKPSAPIKDAPLTRIEHFRFQELMTKKDTAPNFWTSEDEEELQELLNKL